MYPGYPGFLTTNLATSSHSIYKGSGYTRDTRDKYIDRNSIIISVYSDFSSLLVPETTIAYMFPQQ